MPSFAAMTTLFLGDVSMCIDVETGKTTPCKPGNQVCPPGLFGPTTPQFHVKDASCGENDPNGPSYDPVHGVYHLHYQNHVGLHGGRTYGHAVSRDLKKWAHMPISIWNDQPYDEKAIFTGSATIVDGKVVQVYPGLCDPKGAGCPGSTNLCIAKPADPTDPLQTNWSKAASFTGAVNPILNNTGRDPSTAWKTAAGEWRLTTFNTIIYGSLDFNTWYTIGEQPGFPHGECPSFFPLPATTPGAGPAPAGAKTYTHVHKASHGGKDWMQVGTYVENGVKQNGNWTAEPEVRIDAGALYASKDFYDPVKKRRINWGWARVPPASTQTLPREVTWHPQLQQLVYSPLAEQDELRGDSLAAVMGAKVGASQVLPLFDAASAKHIGSRGNQSEVLVKFPIPAEDCTFGVVVMGGEDPATGMLFYVDYKKPSSSSSSRSSGVYEVTVGAKAGGANVKPTPAPGLAPPTPAGPYARLMPNWNMIGEDFQVSPEGDKTPAECQALCDKSTKCHAWTLVPNKKCCLKHGVPHATVARGMTSGVKDPNNFPTPAPGPAPGPGPAPAAGTTDVLKLSPDDKIISVQVYVDNTFSEAYWQGGRIAMTVITPATTEASMGLYSSIDTTVASANVWSINPIWVESQHVLNTPRKDGKEHP